MKGKRNQKNLKEQKNLGQGLENVEKKAKNMNKRAKTKRNHSNNHRFTRNICNKDSEG
jgi:hypothetical protein